MAAGKEATLKLDFVIAGGGEFTIPFGCSIVGRGKSVLWRSDVACRLRVRVHAMSLNV